MKLYTKCNECCAELEIIDFATNLVADAINLNDKILCNDCAKILYNETIKAICKTYSLDKDKCDTFIKDEILYLHTALGGINKKYNGYYGFNNYSFTVNTKTLIPSIRFDDNYFSLEGMNPTAIKKVIELVKIMCD